MRRATLCVLLIGCTGPQASSGEGDVAGGSSGEIEASGGGEEPSGGSEDAPPSDHPDAQSNTPHEATYTRCDPPPPAGCTDCGLTIQLQRSMAWRPAEYEFEILTEGNHIRCAVTLPCTSPEPVACSSSPGAPRVVVETAGCGGPAAEQRIVALHFAPDACPAEARLEAFRAGVGAGNEAITPHYANGRATGTFRYRR